MFVGVTGHQDIPDPARAYIEHSIREIIAQLEAPVIGVSSLAEGADQLFAQILHDLGDRLYVVVPSHQYESAFQNDLARNLYKTFLQQAETIETFPFAAPSEEAFFAAGRRVADLSNLLIAIWDGKEAKGEGGTADIVAYARERDKKIVVVWPNGLNRT